LIILTRRRNTLSTMQLRKRRRKPREKEMDHSFRQWRRRTAGAVLPMTKRTRLSILPHHPRVNLSQEWKQESSSRALAVMTMKMTVVRRLPSSQSGSGLAGRRLPPRPSILYLPSHHHFLLLLLRFLFPNLQLLLLYLSGILLKFRSFKKQSLPYLLRSIRSKPHLKVHIAASLSSVFIRYALIFALASSETKSKAETVEQGPLPKVTGAAFILHSLQHPFLSHW